MQWRVDFQETKILDVNQIGNEAFLISEKTGAPPFSRLRGAP